MSRYSIYECIGKKLSFNAKSVSVVGICDDVKRNILEQKISFFIGGSEYCFLEPNKIEKEEDQLIFVYGSEQDEDLVEFCGENYNLHWGEDVRKSIGREKSFLRIPIKVENK